MQDLAKLLKLMHVYTHIAHNLVSRVPFHSDHAFFGEVYIALLEEYDSVVERSIGLLGDASINFKEIEAYVAQRLATLPIEGLKENSVFYITLLQLEGELCNIVKLLTPKASPGTQQLIGEICNQSEIRQYKIKRRLIK